MTEETGQGKTEIRPKIKLRKKIVPFEEGNPSEEPLFINYAQAAHAGGSFYLDVGIIPLDEILLSSDEATFLVLSRLVMSRETMIAMEDQIKRLLSGVGDRVVALD